MRSPVYPTLNYERHYSEENRDQTQPEHEVGNAPVIPRINPELFRERKGLGICHRSVAFCHHRGDLSLANLRRRRCAERISLAHAELRSRARCGPESFWGNTGPEFVD